VSDEQQSADFESRLSDLRAWLVLLARLHLDFRFQDREASDVVQEALVDAVKYRDKIEWLTSSELEYWLRRVLRNKVIDFYRKKRPEIGEADLDRMEADVGDSFLRIEELVADSKSSPSEHVAKQEELLRLASALEKVTNPNREVLILKDLAGWRIRSIAERLGCTEGVVAGRLRRARNELYQLLGSSND
jgi:RNA polymerase sigma factor (sigma-70 family)